MILLKKFWIGYISLNALLGILSILARGNIIIQSVIILLLIVFNALLFAILDRTSKKLHSTFSDIIEGQLNLNIKRSNIRIIDSIGQKINEYLKKIRNLVSQYQNFAEKAIMESGEITRQSESLQTISREIATTTQNIAESASDQAESIYNITSNVESFSGDVKEIYENAKQSLDVAKDSKDIVTESFEVLGESFNKVEEIKEYNDKVVEEIIDLDKSIREINAITEAVDNIASQTHLLALNASIEAARAGDAGAGFAVVAEEVSKLADNSSESAQQIKNLINNVVNKIDNLTENMKTQTEVISDNIQQANEALKKSDDINKSVDENIVAIEVIVQLSQKQNENIDEIVKSIEEINDTTQHNSAISEEITASTQEQLSIIETMYNSIIYLNDAIEYSNDIIVSFIDGFKKTDEISHKINETEKLMESIISSKELANLEGDKLEKYLIDKQHSLEYVELIALINQEGYQTFTTQDVPEELRDVSGRPYFQEAMKGKTFITDEYISTFTSNFNITIAAPIIKNGKVEGVILGDININED